MSDKMARTDVMIAIYVLVAFMMLIVPLPAAILDVFMAFNIAVALPADGLSDRCSNRTASIYAMPSYTDTPSLRSGANI